MSKVLMLGNVHLQIGDRVSVLHTDPNVDVLGNAPRKHTIGTIEDINMETNSIKVTDEAMIQLFNIVHLEKY